MQTLTQSFILYLAVEKQLNRAVDALNLAVETEDLHTAAKEDQIVEDKLLELQGIVDKAVEQHKLESDVHYISLLNNCKN